MWLNKIACVGEYMWCDKKEKDENTSINDDEWDKALEKIMNRYLIAFLILFYWASTFLSTANNPKATDNNFFYLSNKNHQKYFHGQQQDSVKYFLAYNAILKMNVTKNQV